MSLDFLAGAVAGFAAASLFGDLMLRRALRRIGNAGKPIIPPGINRDGAAS